MKDRLDVKASLGEKVSESIQPRTEKQTLNRKLHNLIVRITHDIQMIMSDGTQPSEVFFILRRPAKSVQQLSTYVDT
ncbi:unnamed protein product [Allacma fusca]|uniref:Uncharacterized protein n=1 Tax=Allacma fusca TaxID=39272 RepID=A0A8J2JY21_9HEXA|nr:unnamed protein product [Allacma fusca]